MSESIDPEHKQMHEQTPAAALALAHRVEMMFKGKDPHFDARCDECAHLLELAKQILEPEVRWCCAACHFPMVSLGWMKCPRCKVQLQ